MRHVSFAPLSLSEEHMLRRIDGGVCTLNLLAADDLERLKTIQLVEQVDCRIFITQLGKSRLAPPNRTKLFFGGTPGVARNNYKTWKDLQKGIRLIHEPALYQAGSGWSVEIRYAIEEVNEQAIAESI